MEPPDPMFTKDTPKIEIIKWYAVALPVILVWYCHMPFAYLFRSVQGWHGRQTSLTAEQVLDRIEGEGRYAKAGISAFLLADSGDGKRYTLTVLPAWHPAIKRIVVKSSYQHIEVRGHW